jgi:hypothetical protein
MKRLVLWTVLLTAVLAAGAATAVATPNIVSGGSKATQSTGPAVGTVSVKFQINKFVKSGRNLIAKGEAVATFTPQSGAAPTVVRQPFSVRASVAPRLFSAGGQQRICQILTLQLDTLSLNLLGLHVDLSKVVLTITANSRGGILGRLFCSLASGRVRLATVSNAQKLTKLAHTSGLSTKGIGFAIPANHAQAMAPGPCQVLDLVLGPLHLDLLGLIVDLNQIHLQITADPAGGILGSLLCSLTNLPPTTVGPSP